MSPSWVAWCSSSLCALLRAVISRMTPPQYSMTPCSSRLMTTSTSRSRSTPSGLRNMVSPDHCTVEEAVSSARGIWSRRVCSRVRTAGSRTRSTESSTPNRRRAAVLQYNGAPLRSRMMIESDDGSTTPSSRVSRLRSAMVSVSSMATPAYPTWRPASSNSALALTRTQRKCPSRCHTRNATVRSATSSEAARQAVSATDRSAGWALVHGVVRAPGTSPLSASARNAALAAVMRPSRSVRKIATGREGSVCSMSIPVSETRGVVTRTPPRAQSRL